MTPMTEVRVSNWVCSECGLGHGVVNPARPSVDDRYAVGFCESCCPVPVWDPKDPTKTRPRNRRVVQLVRSDVWDPTLLAARREERRIRKLFDGKGSRTADQAAEMADIRRRWETEAEARRA